MNPLSSWAAVLTYAQPDLPAACSAETLPERWRTDHGWQLSQHTAKREKTVQSTTCLLSMESTNYRWYILIFYMQINEFASHASYFHFRKCDTLLMLQPFSDKCLCVFMWKGLPDLGNWSRTTERGPEPVTHRTRLSPVLSRHRIITEGRTIKTEACVPTLNY